MKINQIWFYRKKGFDGVQEGKITDISEKTVVLASKGSLGYPNYGTRFLISDIEFIEFVKHEDIFDYNEIKLNDRDS